MPSIVSAKQVLLGYKVQTGRRVTLILGYEVQTGHRVTLILGYRFCSLLKYLW
jgi:hypothetical protein